MEFMESSSSSMSLLSSDSLRDAFASLDAASAAERGQYSLMNSLSDSVFHRRRIVRDASSSLQNNSETMRAKRVQYLDVTISRALCGGESLERMKSEVQDRAESNKRRKESENGKAVQTSAPTFQAFPMSIEEAEDNRGTDFQQQLASNVDEEPISLTNTESEQLPLEPSTSHSSTLEIANTQPTKRKRTLQSAARRDRRIARRREAAPLTRSQARQLETQEGNSAHGSSGQQTSLPSITSESLSAEVTDPSFGTVVVEVSIPVKSKAPAAKKKKKKVAPMLDMTFTEQIIRPAIEKQQVSSQESSQTQSDIYSQEQISSTSSKGPTVTGQRMVISGRISSNSSQTEADNDTDEVDQAWRQKSIDAARRKEQTRAPVAAKKRTAKGKQTLPKSDVPRQRGKAKGPNLFHGLNFKLFGFWAKIKTFSSLIEKHGGNVLQTDDITILLEPGKVKYLLACTHSGYKPAPGEVDKWKSQLGKDADTAKEVNKFFAQTKMIQAEWINDCIAKCLRRQDLLSTDSCTITT